MREMRNLKRVAQKLEDGNPATPECNGDQQGTPDADRGDKDTPDTQEEIQMR